MTQNLLIPKNFKFLGKDQQQLYKEAKDKENQQKQDATSKNNILAAKSLGNLVPLIGSDGTTKIFSAIGCIAEAQKQSRVLASLKDVGSHVLNNGGVYWTGEIIVYPGIGETFGRIFKYSDIYDQEYKCMIPSSFHILPNGKALKLMNGYFEDGTPYFEFKQDLKGTWILQFRQPGALVSSGRLKAVSIHRESGWYLTDADGFPNGTSTNPNDKDARYFEQLDYDPYLGLIASGGITNYRLISTTCASSRSSFEALVYSEE